MLNLLLLRHRALIFIFGAVLFFFIPLYVIFLRPPSNFPVGQIIVVSEGLSVREAAQILLKEGVIRSPSTFTILTTIIGSRGVIAGGYLFDKKVNVVRVAFKLSDGNYGVSAIRATFPEGISVREAAKICTKLLPACKEEDFILLGGKNEGYLFPDTYFFLPGAKASEVIALMEDNFKQKITLLNSDIKRFGKPLKDVVIIASILEGEAKTYESRQIIAGILWKRLSLGMPLQVDTVFRYINGKSTHELTDTDLAIDSPYNTYRYRGLPPGPIGNPGLETLKAAVNPTKTPYLFYLSDKDGNFYYAKNLTEHNKNKELYLNFSK